MDRIESMLVFVRAVELGSFAGAASALGMSGPMVGKHVASLEQRLGTRLLNRTTRRQSLTEFGLAYYDRCKVVIAEAEAADALADGYLREPRGRLRIAMPVHFGRRCLLPFLIEWKRNYPALELDLALSDRLTDFVEEGFDLAIRTGALAASATIVARRLASQRMIVCAAPTYLAKHGHPATVADLQGHHCVVYQRVGKVAPWLFPSDGSQMIEFAPSGGLRLDDLQAIADLAVMGEGLAWLPAWLVTEHIDAGTLVELALDAPCFAYDVHALWLRTPHLPFRTRSAIDLLARELPKRLL